LRGNYVLEDLRLVNSRRGCAVRARVGVDGRS